MSAPIALFVGAALEPMPLLLPAPSPSIEAVPFDVTLGAAIALVVPVMAPAPITVRAPAEPVLDVLLDGKWLPDDFGMPGEVDQPAREDRPAEPRAASGEPMVLEKNLDSWLAAFGRRERSNRPAPDGESDPQMVQLDEPDAAPTGAPDRLTTLIPSLELTGIGLTGVAMPVTVARREVRPTPEVKAVPSDRLAPIIDDGLIDAETLVRTRRVDEPTIEIGGFGFSDLPTLPDIVPDQAPTFAPSAAEVPDRAPVAGPDLNPVALGSQEAPTPATDLIQRSNQSAPADRRLMDVVRLRTVEAARRTEFSAPSRELENIGTHGAGIAGAVLRETGGEASPDSRSSGRRSEDDRPTASAEVMPQRRAPTEQPTFEPRPLAGQAPVAADPVRGEAHSLADSPAPAAPNPFDRIARRVDHLTLDLKDDAGDYGRLRVSVSGPLVRATIMPTDPAMADRLNQEIRQLKMTLQERGFPEPRLIVQAPKPADPVSWVPISRDIIADPAPAEQPNTQRLGGDDDRRERWTANRDQRRDEQRQQEHARKPRQDQRGDPE